LNPVKTLCFLNYPSHYRENIYLALEKELNCDFVFGNLGNSNIKKIEKNKFKNPYVLLQTKYLFKSINYIKGGLKYCFKPYNKYLLTGEYYCITVWLQLILNLFLGKKTYLWTHGWYGNEGFFKKIIKKTFFGLSSGVFLYGEYAKEKMIENGFKESKLHVIFNSLDYTNQLKHRKQLTKNNVFLDKFTNRNPTLIFIGRLTKVKKLEQVITAKINCKTAFNLVFIGNGEEKENLENLVTKHDIKHTTWFYGACYNESELASLIYNADICVSPGNVGLTAMHSLMYGTPVITHNNFANQMPEFESIVENETGFFFEENDIESLSKVIEQSLAKITVNKEFYKQKCYEVIDKFYNPNYQMSIFKKHLS